MRILLLFIIGILYTLALRTDKVGQEEDAILATSSPTEDTLLGDALFEGLVDGYTFTLDCVTLSKHDHDKDNASEKQLSKEHSEHVSEAKLDAEHMTKHRPMESQVVDKKEGTLFAELNILIHYLNSRGQDWSLREPVDLGFEQSGENHMAFESKANDAADVKIPANLFYSVGNMKKTIPPHKDGKKPILLTCLESFIVSRLGFLSMEKLAKSQAPVEEKLEYLKRWISVAKKHYILYLPYIAITAPRCHDLLKGTDNELKPEFENNSHYKHLFHVCNKMLEKRQNDGVLQTYVMLDSDLHPDLMKTTIEDRHLFPLMLQDRENTLRTIHEHHKHEMDWDQFQGAGNLLLAELEQQILNHDAEFLKAENWGIGLAKEASKEAEMRLIKLFVKSQKRLNSKVLQTVRTVSHEGLTKSQKGDEELKKSILKFSEMEQESAKKESRVDNLMDKCMKEAEERLDKDFEQFKNENRSTIANDMRSFAHDSWMECVSSRVFDKLKQLCRENEDYCKSLMDQLKRELDTANPDSSSTIALENFHYAVTSALLSNDQIDMKDVKNHILKVSRDEIRDMSETPKNHTEAEPKQDEKEKSDEGSSEEVQEQESSQG